MLVLRPRECHRVRRMPLLPFSLFDFAFHHCSASFLASFAYARVCLGCVCPGCGCPGCVCLGWTNEFLGACPSRRGHLRIFGLNLRSRTGFSAENSLACNSLVRNSLTCNFGACTMAWGLNSFLHSFRQPVSPSLFVTWRRAFGLRFRLHYAAGVGGCNAQSTKGP